MVKNLDPGVPLEGTHSLTFDVIGRAVTRPQRPWRRLLPEACVAVSAS
jgi:hypothetical protein